MCVMEENKQHLEFIAPEVKVVNIAPQSRILQESKALDIEAYYDPLNPPTQSI